MAGQRSRLFRLCLSADASTLELQPCMPHLTEASAREDIEPVSKMAYCVSESSTALPPPQPAAAERLATEDIDAWETSFFQEYDPALAHAERWDRIDPVNSRRHEKASSGSSVGKRMIKRAVESQHSFHPPPMVPPVRRASIRWGSLVCWLLRRHGVWLNNRLPLEAANRKRLWSAREIKRWEQRHGPRENPITPWEARSHGVLLRQEARAKPVRSIDVKRENIAGSSSSCHVVQTVSVTQPLSAMAVVDPWAGLRAPISAALDASLDADLVMAFQLGLDEQTFRQLRALERRDIRPEDYDLLGQLDQNIKPATLTSKDLKWFPTESYRLTTSLKHDACPDASALSVDFWRLPLPSLEDALEVSMPLEVCGVCLVDFYEGDQLRKLLPCGHRFHRDCIDRWLLEASTTCPVDNLDLRSHIC